MKVDKVIERIEYLRTEIAHDGFWDGWSLKGMRDELSDLETKLYFNNRNQQIEELINKNE
jgi:hypothetical protein|tara:strand:+ start:277 stop:456 length:180 start_codon:yes stop_codon:yes gene_type:complete